MKILNKPYPLELNLKINLKTSLLVATFIALFLYVFQPIKSIYNGILMEINETIHYGLISGLMVFSFGFILPKFFEKIYKESHWTVFKEIIQNLVMVLFIGLLNLFYTINYSISNNDLNDLFTQVVGSTFLIAIFPIVAIVFYRQNNLLKQYIEESKNINTVLHKKTSIEKINVLGEGKNEQLEIEYNDLYFIKSQGNYCEFHLKENDQPILLRISLTNLEQQFSTTDIYKCHRSYLVNIGNVINVSGNAQGLRLHFETVEESIPVSRNLTKEVKQLLIR